MWDCVPREGLHAGAGEQHEEEGAAEAKRHDLTTTIPHPPVQLGAVKEEVKESGAKLILRRRAWGESSFSLIYWHEIKLFSPRQVCFDHDGNW